MPSVTSPVPESSESTRVLGISDLEKVEKCCVITLDQYLVAGNFLISYTAWEGSHSCIFSQIYHRDMNVMALLRLSK